MIGQAVQTALRQDGYAVDWVRDAESADTALTTAGFDLVLLDLGLPGRDGVDLLRTMRTRHDATPVLIVTARDDVHDRVGGLDAGADDYLVKPFDFAELLARVRSLLRRREKPLQATLEAGDLVLDRGKHEVRVGERPIDLSPKEFALLEYFLSRKDEVVSRAEIEEHVWDSSFDSFTNIVDVLVHRLRKKIDGDLPQRLLHTVKGAGYRLSSERQ